MFFKFVFRRVTEDLYIASGNEIEERPVVSVNILLLFFGNTKVVVITVAVDFEVFKPIYTVEML